MITSIVAATALAFSGQVPAADVKALTNLYPSFCKLFTDGKWDRVTKTLAPDFFHADTEGKKQGRAAYVKDCTGQFGSMKGSTLVCKFIDFKSVGSNVAVHLTYKLTGKAVDEKGKHAIEASGEETQTWHKANGAWIVKSIVEHTSKLVVDGQVISVAPGKAG